jgi:hypothetical protein
MAWGFSSTLRNALTQHRSLRVSRRCDMIHANGMIDVNEIRGHVECRTLSFNVAKGVYVL